jgi:exodeoxyribonuclease V gamma subunit
MQGLRRLAHWQRALANPRSPAEWGQALAQLIGDFTPERAHDAADRLAIDELRALAARFARQAQEAQMDAPVPASVMRAWFAAALAEADPRQPFLTGGVTFGRMVPLRLVPFKVICLLGMNDGEFPRREPPGSLNRLVAALDGVQRRPGDRSVREDDRGLFLQLLAAATHGFYLSYLGQDPRSGESLPPSVVVSELLEVASRYFAAPQEARDALVVVEPLQPFSPAAFGGGEAPDARRSSFQSAWREGAAAALGARAPTSRFASTLPAPEVAAQGDWTREQLLRALSNPSREFLSERLGMRLAASSERLPEAEPFALDDGLDRWQRDSRVLDLCLAQTQIGEVALARRLLAEGRIAPGAAGRAAVARSLDAVAPALAAWRGDPEPSHPLRVHPSGLRQFTASKAHGKTLLALGLDALVWSALGNTQPIERIVCEQPRLQLAPLPAAQARAKLLWLLEFALRARAEVLPFMPKAGLKFAIIEDADKATEKAERAWNEDYGEGRDPWVGVALRGAAPFEDALATRRFGEYARELFAGLPGVSAGADEAESVDD